MDQNIRDYLRSIARKGGSVKGKCKARKMSREHYLKVGKLSREYWEKWRAINGRVKGKRKRSGSVNQTAV